MILYYLLTFVYVIVCTLLLLVVLLQQGKGDIAAAFGGGSSQSAFGARTGATVLSKATAVLAALFMVGALALVGEGKWTADELSAALEKRDRAACAPVAPPEGLYLAGVDYP